MIAVIAFGCLLASEFLAEAYFHDDAYYQDHGWPKLAGFLLAAAMVWALAKRRAVEPGVVEPRGSDPLLKRSDALFFVPARYWPAILGALGVVFYFVRD